LRELVEQTAPASPAGPEVAGARGATPPAVAQLLEKYRNYLLLIANAELDQGLRHKLGASDLVQDTLIRAHGNFENFKGTNEEQLRGWLRQILINQCRNARQAFRSSKRDVNREYAVDQAKSGSIVCESIPDEGRSPSSHAAACEEAVLVADALSGLRDDYQLVIRLRNWEDLSFEEIGRQMQRSPRTVRKLWFQAVQALGRQMGLGS
jgi:RNA polymerase sigma-70 factor (ECF subfamily)